MRRIIFIAGFIMSILIPGLYAKEGEGNYSIIENKGQWNDSVRYKVDIAQGSLFITDYGWVYDFVDVKDLERYHDMLSDRNRKEPLPDSFAYKGHAYRVSFSGAKSSGTRYEPMQKKVTKYHYYQGSSKKDWHTDVSGFDALLQRELYNHIDLKLYQSNASLKYDFIVHPGGDYRDIVLEYEGVTPQIREDGTLLLETTVNTITEDKPYVYQVVDNRKKEIRAAYRKNKLGYIVFELLDDYDRSEPLIIDPKLIFATYSGCPNFSLAFSSTYDNDGNFYAMGTQALAGDRYKNIFQGYTMYTSRGGSGVGINKYSADGTTLHYSLTLSSFASEAPSCLTTDKDRNLYVGLKGPYTSFVPMHDNALYNRSKGGDDIYICKLNEAGNMLMGATFIGGSRDEGGYADLGSLLMQRAVEVKILDDNKIGIISQTRSDDYPVTPDALYPRYGGGSSDGVFTVLDGNLSQLLYSTYIGGSGDDFCSDLVFTADRKVVITGGSESSNLTTTPGVFQRAHKGGTDGFIMVLDKDYKLEKGTYLGTDSNDHVYLADIDKESNIYVLCYSRSYKLPLSSDGFHIDSGDYKIFILNKDLSSINRGIRIGTFTPSAFMVDVCGYVYLSGYDLKKAPLSPNALGKEGLWIGVFTPNLYGLKFATRYGTPDDHYHNGVVRFDKKGVIYQTVCSANFHYPTTSNAVYPDKIPGTAIEPVSFKIDMEPELVFAEIRIPAHLSDTGCAPYTLPFINRSSSPFSITYEWDFGTGVQDTAFEPTYTFEQTGTYTVVLKATSLKSCNQVAYDTFLVHIVQQRVDVLLQDTVLCQNVSYYDIQPRFSYPLTDSARYQWGGSSGIMGADNASRLRVNPAENAIYYLSVTDSLPGICAVSLRDTVVIDMVYRNFEIRTTPSCFNASNGQAYAARPAEDTTVFSYWWLSPALDTLQTGDTFKNAAAGHYLLNVVSDKCNNLFAFSIDTLKDRVSFSYDSLICQHAKAGFYSNLNRDVYPEWQWQFEGRPVSDQPVFDTVLHQAGRYRVQLLAEGPVCKDTMSVELVVDPKQEGSFTLYPDSVCVGDKVTFVPGSEMYVTKIQWLLADYTISGYVQEPITHAFDRSGRLPVRLQTSYRVCPDNVYAQYVDVFSGPDVDLGTDGALCYQGESITLRNLRSTLPDTDRYLWSTGDTTATIKVTHPGTYRLLQSRPPLGCVGSETITIDKDCFIDIPNVFSPNGDGINDYFFPRPLLSRGVVQFRLEIFNRWGQLLFETGNPDGMGWDGQWNGMPQPVGTYIYRLALSFADGRTENREGNITILR